MHVVFFASALLSSATLAVSMCTYICEIINELEYSLPPTNYHANQAATKQRGTVNLCQIVGEIPQCAQRCPPCN